MGRDGSGHDAAAEHSANGFHGWLRDGRRRTDACMQHDHMQGDMQEGDMPGDSTQDDGMQDAHGPGDEGQACTGKRT